MGNLELRIGKQRNQFGIIKKQTLAKKYDSLATSKLGGNNHLDRFAMPRADEQARMTEVMKQNEELEAMLRQVVAEKPQFEIIVNPLLGW